jgi:hypothetical protein
VRETEDVVEEKQKRERKMEATEEAIAEGRKYHEVSQRLLVALAGFQIYSALAFSI